MAKKFKIKEAELLDDQMKEQNAPESTVIPATPEEVSQATDNVADIPAEEPVATEAPINADASIETPNGSAEASDNEAESPMGSGIEVQPETVSINVQIPVQQLGQAVAMATGDVRMAELSPDLEAEKAKQAEDAEKQPMVAEADSEAPIQEPVLGGAETEAVSEPTDMVEPQPVQESLEHTTESREPDPNEMGASYRALMELDKQREAKANCKHDLFNESEDEVNPNEMGASFRALLKLKKKLDEKNILGNHSKLTEDVKEEAKADESVTDNKDNEAEEHEDADKAEVEEVKNPEVVEDAKTSENDSDKKDELKEKLDFNALKNDVVDDYDNSGLPHGLGETDENFDAELGFGSDSPEFAEDFADIGNLFADTLEDKSSEEISTAAEALDTVADILGDVADTLEDKAEEAQAEENADNDADTKEPKEKLDFKALLDDFSDDYYDEDDEDVDAEDDFAEDYLEDEDFEESRKRVPCKLPVNSNFSERREMPSIRHHVSPRFEERKMPLVKSRESILTESAQKTLRTPMRSKLTENADLDGIILPKGSEGIDLSYYETDDDLVSAHERVLEARKRALMDFHKALNESNSRPRVAESPRYRESIREDRAERPSNSRFNEALRSSVRATRVNDEEYSANSWANNKALDKYEESQKFNFKELLKNGFLG